MKTKKAILAWWHELGKKPMSKRHSDYEQFRKLIDTSIKTIEILTWNKNVQVSLRSPRWKFPLYLTFDRTGECFNIKGF